MIENNEHIWKYISNNHIKFHWMLQKSNFMQHKSVQDIMLTI